MKELLKSAKLKEAEARHDEALKVYAAKAAEAQKAHLAVAEAHQAVLVARGAESKPAAAGKASKAKKK